MDMFGGGSYADMMERSALQHAEGYVAEVRNRVLLAQHFDRNIVSLPQVHIASGSIMTDVFFDNIFTDMDFHDKIKRSKMEVTQAQNALKDQTMKARARLQEAKQALAAREETLKVRRGELQQLRENAFRQVAEIGAPPAYAPPEYTE
jgi:oligoendopeptidase F